MGPRRGRSAPEVVGRATHGLRGVLDAASGLVGNLPPARRGRLLDIARRLARRFLEVLDHVLPRAGELLLQWLDVVADRGRPPDSRCSYVARSTRSGTRCRRRGRPPRRAALGALPSRLRHARGRCPRWPTVALCSCRPRSCAAPITGSRTRCTPCRARFVRRSMMRPGLTRSPIASRILPSSARVSSMSRLSSSGLWPIAHPP